MEWGDFKNYGWPCPFYFETEVKMGEGNYPAKCSPSFVALDLTVALGIIGAVALVSESLLRRRGARKP
jgi:hypothetical protein